MITQIKLCTRIWKHLNELFCELQMAATYIDVLHKHL